MAISQRWAVPGAVAAAVVAALAIPGLASASNPALPETTASELLAASLAVEPQPLSGTVSYTANLGLPEVAAELTGGADPLNLLGGTSTIRVWTDGESRSRASLLGSTSEYVAVADGTSLWRYSSADNTASHLTLDESAIAELEARGESARAQFEAEHGPLDAATLPTPEQVAEQLLALAQEDAEVTLGEQTTVAGRAAYQLVLDPTTPGTLVDKAVLAIDGETSIPLAAEVWSTRDANAPALAVAFTDLTFGMPNEDALSFTAPSGATVTEKVITAADLPPVSAWEGEGHDGAAGVPGTLPAGVAVVGEGWASVLTMADAPLLALLSGDPAAAAELADEAAEAAGATGGDDAPWADDPNADFFDDFLDDGDGDGSAAAEEGSAHPGFELDTAALLDQLTTEVDGGRLLETALLSVLALDDGRVLVGAVPGETLLTLAQAN